MRSVTSIEIPESVTTIKGNFFKFFTGLKEVVFSDKSKVENIYPMAFADCKNLGEIVIPENCEGKPITIHVDAFVGCNKAKKIEVPKNSVTRLFYKDSLSGCDSLEELHLKGTVERYEPHIKDGNVEESQARIQDIEQFGLGMSEAYIHPVTDLEEFLSFIDPKKLYISQNSTQNPPEEQNEPIMLKKMTLPRGLKKIGGIKEFARDRSQFEYTAIESLVLNDDLEIIGPDTFSGCYRLKYIKIPESVKKIGDAAFHGCSGLASIKIPNSVDEIEALAFSECYNITKITLPDSLPSIPWALCRGCESLVQINIPDTVTSIDEQAFSGCKALSNIELPSKLSNIGNYAFSSCMAITKLNLPDSVTSIGEGAFSGCFALEELRFPSMLETIGNHAFGTCSSLTSITLPGSVSSVGHSAFQGCKNLQTVLISDGVEKIDSYAFFSCPKLSKVQLPSSIKEIGKSAFASHPVDHPVDGKRNIVFICKNDSKIKEIIRNGIDSRYDSVQFVDPANLPKRANCNKADWFSKLKNFLLNIPFLRKKREAREKIQDDMNEQHQNPDITE